MFDNPGQEEQNSGGYAGGSGTASKVPYDDSVAVELALSGDMKRLGDYLARTGAAGGVSPEVSRVLKARANGDANTFRRLQASLSEAVKETRKEAFRRGEILPGVSPDGAGLGFSNEELAAIRAGVEVQRSENLIDAVPGVDAYTPAYIEEQRVTGLQDRLKDSGLSYTQGYEDLELTPEELAVLERSDTAGLDAQKRALAAMEEAAGQGGLTDIDRARIEQIRQTTARQARAQEEAILADQAEKGRAGSMQSALLRSQAQQAAADARGLHDAQTAALGLARKDALTEGAGYLGGRIQDSSDAIDKFNTENKQGVYTRNATRSDTEATSNWTEKNQRQKADVATQLGALEADWNYDADFAGREQAGRQDVENFTHGPQGGARGQWNDYLAAQGGGTQQAAGLGVNTNMGIQQNKDDRKREQEDRRARREAAYLSAGTDLLTLGANKIIPNA